MNKRPLIKSFSIVTLIVFLFCIPLFLKQNYWLYVLSLVCLNVLLASSLRTINLTGELSLGHVGFMLIGAYSSAILSLRMGIPVFLTMLLGGLLAALVALVLGYPILRTKGVYFSILTFIVAEIFRLTMFYTPSLSGGPPGLFNIPPPSAINIFGITNITFDTRISYYYLLLSIVLLSLVILFRVERSLGFRWMAIRQNDALTESVGINVMGYKLIAFVIGCFFAGITGALYAHFMQVLTADSSATFGMLTSIYIVIYMIVGGQASFVGPIIGAVILTLVSEFIRSLKEYQPIFFGVLVIFIVFFMRQGLVSLPYYLTSWWRKALKKKPESKVNK